MRYHEIAEAFSDLGKLSPDQLAKGQSLKNPGAAENFQEVTGRVFHAALSRIKRNDFIAMNAGLPSKGLHTLSVYSIPEYAKMRCFIGANNSSGFAIKGDELVSVFSSQNSSGRAIVAKAVQDGVKRLDCFATRHDGQIGGPLFKLYSEAGFQIDTGMNEGNPGQPYAVVNGVSDFVDDAGHVHPDDERVVIFMRHP